MRGHRPIRTGLVAELDPATVPEHHGPADPRPPTSRFRLTRSPMRARGPDGERTWTGPRVMTSTEFRAPAPCRRRSVDDRFADPSEQQCRRVGFCECESQNSFGDDGAVARPASAAGQRSRRTRAQEPDRPRGARTAGGSPLAETSRRQAARACRSEPAEAPRRYRVVWLPVGSNLGAAQRARWRKVGQTARIAGFLARKGAWVGFISPPSRTRVARRKSAAAAAFAALSHEGATVFPRARLCAAVVPVPPEAHSFGFVVCATSSGGAMRPSAASVFRHGRSCERRSATSEPLATGHHGRSIAELWIVGARLGCLRRRGIGGVVLPIPKRSATRPTSGVAKMGRENRA